MDDRRNGRYWRYTTEVGGKPTNTPTAKNAAQSVVTVDDEMDVNIGETIGYTGPR